MTSAIGPGSAVKFIGPDHPFIQHGAVRFVTRLEQHGYVCVPPWATIPGHSCPGVGLWLANVPSHTHGWCAGWFVPWEGPDPAVTRRCEEVKA